MATRTLWRALVLIWYLSGAGLLTASAGNLAFVVGIDAYPKLAPEAQLTRAEADADAVSKALTKLGFQVMRVPRPATLETVLRGFGKFTAAIAAGDTVLFYFAGHGMALDDGTYLVPADIPALTPTDTLYAKRVSIAEKDISRGMRDAGARASIVIIDACRDNPFLRSGTRALGSATRGLARLLPSEGVYTLYLAREGQTALDRLQGKDDDPNSVFTRVLLQELKPGVSLNELGAIVRDKVANLAKSDGHDQVPAVYDDLIGARLVYLAGPPPSEPAAPKATSQAFVATPQQRPAALETATQPAMPAREGPVPSHTAPEATSTPTRTAVTQEAGTQAAGRREPGWLGLRLTPVTAPIARSYGARAPHGAFVTGVAPLGPAARAGIRAGDVIIRIDNETVELPRDLAGYVAAMPAARSVSITAYRRGRRIQFSTDVGEQR